MALPRKRTLWVDCAKGFGILFVILGHSVGDGFYSRLVRALIFSFHMPLFFILSGFVFRYSASDREFLSRTGRSSRQLLFPVLAVTFISVFYNIRFKPALLSEPLFWRDQLFRLLIGNARTVTFGSLQIPAVGSLWFLYALLFVRSISDYLHLHFDSSKCLFLVWLISLLGIALGSSDIILPFSLDIALAVIPFFWFGKQFKESFLRTQPVRNLFLFALIWLLTLWIQFPDYREYSYLELAMKRYPLFPLCFFCATAGSLFLCQLSIIITKAPLLSFPLCWIGKNSLYLLCIHQLDIYWEHRWLSDSLVSGVFKRILIDLIILIVFVLLKTIVLRLTDAYRHKPTGSLP